MILAIPIDSESQDSPIAQQFARAKYFAVADRNKCSIEILPNPCLGMSAKVGKCAILYLTTRKSVDTLVAHEIGLNVQQMAQKQNIRLILIDKKYKKLNELFKLMKFKAEV